MRCTRSEDGSRPSCPGRAWWCTSPARGGPSSRPGAPTRWPDGWLRCCRPGAIRRARPASGSGASSWAADRSVPPSARGVEQAADRHALVGELVVELGRGHGLLDVSGDPPVAQEVEGLRARPELELLPAAQHHDLASMHQELLDVGGLDARVVMGPGLVPVPRPSATGPELE